MVQLYVNLIRNNMWTIDQVPPRWKSEVEAELAKTPQP